MLNSSRLLILWLLGFISGFTILLTSSTLNYWLSKESIDLKSIGIFAFILIPYSINFLWAPIFDTVTLGKLTRVFGQRLAWFFLTQTFLSLFILTLSLINPNQNLLLFAAIALIIAFFSSAQDTILGAFKTEIIARKSQGPASGVYIFGYRIGMLISGSGAIYLSTYLKMNQIYAIFAAVIPIYSVILLLSTRSIERNKIDNQEEWYKFNLYNILKPIGSFSFVALVIIFLVLYRLPDNFIGMMINPFLIHLEYNAIEIAAAGKFWGTIGAIIGGLIASLVMRKKNITESLFIFGIIHALAHILFIVQEIYGKDLKLLFITIGCESITGGMVMTAYIAFIASLCSGKFRATQYSFFSSMMGFSRAIFPALSGYMVVSFGWQSFFMFTTLVTFPSFFILRKIQNYQKQLPLK